MASVAASRSRRPPTAREYTWQRSYKWPFTRVEANYQKRRLKHKKSQHLLEASLCNHAQLQSRQASARYSLPLSYYGSGDDANNINRLMAALGRRPFNFGCWLCRFLPERGRQKYTEREYVKLGPPLVRFSYLLFLLS